MLRRLVVLVSVALLALALVACDDPLLETILPSDQPSSPGDGGGPGSPGSTDGGSTDGGGADGGGADGGGADGGGADGGGSDGNGGDGAPAVTPVNDSGGLGANGPAMLRSDRSMILLEIDVQEGASPDSSAVAHLVGIIERYSGKTVQQAGGNTFASSEREWTVGKLRDAVAANRSTSSTDEAVSIHVLYVQGGLHEDGEETNAIGVAYGASTMALFPDRWAGLGGLVGSDRAIERAVLVHEWGHLLGLINITYESEIDHEDPDHPHHSTNEDSVMFWKVETDLIGQLTGSIPDDFDSADQADMQQIAEGG